MPVEDEKGKKESEKELKAGIGSGFDEIRISLD